MSNYFIKNVGVDMCGCYIDSILVVSDVELDAENTVEDDDDDDDEEYCGPCKCKPDLDNEEEMHWDSQFEDW